MSKSKNQFSVSKAIRVMRVAADGYEPASYEVWKVSGPRGLKKYFVTKSDAQAFIKKQNDTTMDMSIVRNILREVNYK